MLTRYLILGLICSLALAFIWGEATGGVVLSVLLGFMAGNFACSLVHRLPRGKPILEHKPYCGECAHALNEEDLLPVFGALMLKHQCRYCGANIPKSHFWTEILLGALFAACFLRFGWSQEYLLLAALGTFFAVLSFIEYNDKLVMNKVLVVVLVLGALWRTLHDGEVFDWFLGGVLGLVIGAGLWRKEIKPLRHMFTFPDGAKLLAVAGVCVGLEGLPYFFVLYAVLWGVLRVFRVRLMALPVALAALALQFVEVAELTAKAGINRPACAGQECTEPL